MIKNDKWIREMGLKGMITPFEPELIRQVNAYHDPYDTAPIRRVLSYGTSSYGYDIRLSDKEFWIFNEPENAIIDPKNFDAEDMIRKGWLILAERGEDEDGRYFLQPGHTVGLGVALERLNMPPNVSAIFLGKSTYARVGEFPIVTPGEARWEGYLTLEFYNAGRGYRKVYSNEGCLQALFFEGEPCDTTYADRFGKYQDQPQNVVFAKV
jgi:dCTP deaminase